MRETGASIHINAFYKWIVVSWIQVLKKLASDFIRSKETETLSTLAFTQSPVATFLADSQGVILETNLAFEKLSGYLKSELTGKNMSWLQADCNENEAYESFWEKIVKENRYDHEIYNRCKDDSVLLMKKKVACIRKGLNIYYVVKIEDITEQKKKNDRNMYLATHDALTGLQNRTLFLEHFSYARQSSVKSTQSMGILMCDINEFKSFNDSYGHNAGDIILQKVATKLKDVVGKNDTVFRHGGDEFVVILKETQDSAEILKTVESIKSEFPLILEGNEDSCHVAISVGHACFPEDGTTLDQLTHIADMRMYHEKKEYYGFNT